MQLLTAFFDYSLCMLRQCTWESQTKKLQHYKLRQPETPPLYQIVFHSHEELQGVRESTFQDQYGCLRDEVAKTLKEHLNCRQSYGVTRPC